MKPQVDGRIRSVKGHEMGRNPVRRDGLAGMDLDAAAMKTGEIGQKIPGLFGAGQCAPGFRQKQTPGAGQGDAASDAVEQTDAVLVLKRSYRRRNGGRGAVDSLRRSRQVLAFGHGDEHAQLLKGHGRAPVHSKKTHEICNIIRFLRNEWP